MTNQHDGLAGLFSQVHALVTLELNGEMSEADRTRLDRLICGDPAARRLYVRYIAETAALERCSADLPSAATAPVESPTRPASPSVQSPHDESFRGVLGFLAGVFDSIQASPRVLAVLVLGGLGTYFAVVLAALIWHRVWQGPQQAEIAPTALRPNEIARLISSRDCRWQTAGAPPTDGASLGSELLLLTAGVAEIEFADGARVLLQGPAEFVPLAAGRSLLTRGRLMASVPQRAIGFKVTTPTVDVIDLGTEFGVEVDGPRNTDVHVLRGEVEVKHLAEPTNSGSKARLRLKAGNAVRLTAGGEVASIPVDRGRFASLSSAAPASGAPTPSKPRRPSGSVTTVWLSNLFDDVKGTPLDEAMRTDQIRATPTLDTLGVCQVSYGNNTIVAIAPKLTVDLENLGWGSNVPPHLIANDAWKENESFGLEGGLRLDGESIELGAPRMRDGIGMHADALVTFDLDEIRSAGHLERSKLEFRCDRAGINDGALDGQDLGSIHLVALVSTKTGVVRGWVDGDVAQMTKQIHQWRVTSTIGKPLRPGGPFFSLRFPLGPEDKYLTLLSASAGDGIQLDHGAWLGARLEIQQPHRHGE